MQTRISASHPLAAILTALTQADETKNKPTTTLAVRPLPLVELMTHILSLHQNMAPDATPFVGMIELAKAEKLFKMQPNQKSVMSFLWPHASGERIINVRVRQRGTRQLLYLDFQYEKRRFMTLTARDSMGISVKLYPATDSQNGISKIFTIY